MALERGMRLYKLGTHRSGEGIVEYRYANLYKLEDSRIAVATESNQVQLLLALAMKLDAPFRLMYVLLESHSGLREGRYSLEAGLDEDDLCGLLLEFRDFLELDARHHVRIESSSGTLIYDQHNIIYAPANPSIEAELTQRGFKPGGVHLPFPHSHHIHAELDSELERLMGCSEWRHEPLLESEDVY